MSTPWWRLLGRYVQARRHGYRVQVRVEVPGSGWHYMGERNRPAPWRRVWRSYQQAPLSTKFAYEWAAYGVLAALWGLATLCLWATGVLR